MSELVTTREAARELDRHPYWVKGAAEALGIKLVLGGQCHLMTRADFLRLKEHDAALRRANPSVARPRGGRRKKVSA